MLASLVIGLSGCADQLAPAEPQLTIQQDPAPEPQPKAEETKPAEPRLDPATVTGAVRSVEPRATVGALVIDRASGTELLAIEPDRPFRSASLVKLLIAIDALEHNAEEKTRKQLSVMLSLSDDNIASALWVADGGPAIVTRTAGRLGLTGARTPAVKGRWGDVLLTAHDVARVYDYVLTALPDPDRTLIVDALARAPREAADGFDQHFGIPDGLGGTWAVKQGWSDSPTDLVFHSSGLVDDGWPYIVVLLTEHPLGVSGRIATRSVTAGAKALSRLF